jgi:hypothetical protein
MKISVLPPIDLARAAAVEGVNRSSVLLAQTSGFGSFSYDPVRRVEREIANAQGPLLEVETAPWDVIQSLMWKRCKGDQSAFNSNEEVGRLTRDFFTSENIKATLWTFSDFDLGMGGILVKYWSQMVLLWNGKPFICFFDHRRQKGLTKKSRRFVFSIMDLNIRQAIPELAEAELVIFRFPQPKNSERYLEAHRCEEELIDEREIRSAISATYKEWDYIRRERSETSRRRGQAGDLGL